MKPSNGWTPFDSHLWFWVDWLERVHTINIIPWAHSSFSDPVLFWNWLQRKLPYVKICIIFFNRLALLKSYEWQNVWLLFIQRNKFERRAATFFVYGDKKVTITHDFCILSLFTAVYFSKRSYQTSACLRGLICYRLLVQILL